MSITTHFTIEKQNGLLGIQAGFFIGTKNPRIEPYLGKILVRKGFNISISVKPLRIYSMGSLVWPEGLKK